MAAVEIVRRFHEEPRDPILNYTLWYLDRSGRPRWTEHFITNAELDTAEKMRDAILKFQTEFVKERWVLLEAYAPERNASGYIRHHTGGYGRLKIERQLESLNG